MIEVPVKAVNVAAMNERVAGGEAAKDVTDKVDEEGAKDKAGATKVNNVKQAANTAATVNAAKENDPPDDPIVQVDANLAATKPPRK